MSNEISDNYGEIMDLNTAIVKFTRAKIPEVLELAEAHYSIAEKYKQIAEALNAGAQESARLIGDALAAELGLAEFAGPDDDDDDDD